MSPLSQQKSSKAHDWNAMYHAGTPPWDTGQPAAELQRVIEKGLLSPGQTLEIGCGTGADAIYLSRKGFEVTAVDSSPMAIERARIRLEDTNEPVRFVLADIFAFTRGGDQYDVLYDAGFYHFIRGVNLDGYLDMLWRITRPGSYYLTLAGATDEQIESGPPQVSEEELRGELGRLFDFVHLRPITLESPLRPEGFKGWSALLRRPAIDA